MTRVLGNCWQLIRILSDLLIPASWSQFEVVVTGVQWAIRIISPFVRRAARCDALLLCFFRAAAYPPDLRFN